MGILDIIALFVFLSGAFIFINTFYLKLPSSIGLMILALILSIVVLIIGNVFPELHLAEHVEEYNFEEILYQLVLSFMLFSGALNIDFRKLSRQRGSILTLAIVGVLISTLIIGSLVYLMLDLLGIHLEYLYCLVFGALISPTDPIAVTKTIERFNLSKSLEIKIAGESLFNDGIAVVLALTLLDIAHASQDHTLTLFETTYIVAADIGGGMFIGLILGYIGYRLLKYIDNDAVEVEVLITLALVMSGTQIAEFIHVSSKQTAVVMGLVVGNEGKNAHVANAAGDYVFKFWKLLEETFSAMLFVLIGLEMLVLDLRFDYLSAGFFSICIVLLGRWVSVYVPIKLMSVKKDFEKDTVSILTWGALRGGLPVALSLSLTPFDGKDIIVTMTYIVVVCSVLYQGLTVPLLMKEHIKNSK